MTGATSSAAGTQGQVPAPSAGDNEKFLRGDGTWQTAEFGHTIVDENDVAYTQRNNLKIINATITDDSTNDTTIVEITGGGGGTTIVQKPTVTVGTYTYNGNTQGPTITDLDTVNTVVTNATKTAAGTYTLTIALANTSTMVWNDLTTADLTYEYTIDKASLTIPTVAGSFTYDDSAKTATVSSFDTNLITQTGTISATNAGTYYVYFDLVDTSNYEWSDGTTVQKSATWTIAKATQMISASSTSVTLPDGTSDSITVTISGSQGTLTATPADSTIATASVSGSTVTITSPNQKSGSTTISVSAASTDNFNASNTVTITVACNYLAIVTFADGTDEQIDAMLEAYYNDEITWAEMGWAVGDTRIIHLNSYAAPNPNSSTTISAQNIAVTIVDHDHHTLATAINGHTKACISVQFREALGSTSYNGQDGTIYVNGDSSYDMTFTKWSSLYMRTFINSTLLGAFTYSVNSSGTALGSGTSFKSMIKPTVHYRHTTYNGTESESVTDTLFLPSYPEIFGTASYSYYVATSPVEGTQLEYYTTASNRIKYANNNGSSSGTAIYWWEGSASSHYYSSYGYNWCYVYTDGSAHYNYGNYAFGLAPAFAM